MIDSGTFGKVYVRINLDTGDLLTVKQLLSGLDREHQRDMGESPSAYKRTQGRREAPQEPFAPQYCEEVPWDCP